MELDIKAGKRVLYKVNNQWVPGTLLWGVGSLNEKGLFLPVEDSNGKVIDKEINELFLDAIPMDESWKDYSDIFMTKDEYGDFIESEDFIKNAEQAYVSDGEYYYYKVNKFTRNWLEKQPFDYIVRLS